MFLNDAIRIADELRDNAISEAQKLIWINELEMKIQSLILRTAPDDMIVYEQVDDTEMLVPKPFDKVYYLWLAAMIDYGNAEYDKYQNDKAMADAAYSDYAKWFMRHFHDDCGNVMYIGGTTKYGLSAYQIAVNHGFEGTEEEWILSLNGKDAYEVAVEKGYQGSEEEFYAQLGVLNGIEERVSADAAAAEAAADRTEAAASRVETAALHAPKVENGNWWVYDAARAAYMDTGVQAQGPAGEPGNGIRNMLWMKDAIVHEEDRIVARRYKLYITLDDGSTTEFTVEGGADGKPGLKGDGISDIYFSEETDDGYLYYARVGVAIYPIMVPRGPKGADGKETVLFVQDDEPTEAKVGDLWFDTDEEVESGEEVADVAEAVLQSIISAKRRRTIDTGIEMLHVISAGDGYIGWAGINVYHSVDGVSWAAVTALPMAPLDMFWDDINERLVALCSNGKNNYVSTDNGMIWSLIESDISFSGWAARAAYGNGKFVIASTDGHVYCSSDLSSWTEVRGVVNSYYSGWAAIAFYGGVFCVTYNGKTAFSEDGLAWTTYDIYGGNNACILFDGTDFLIYNAATYTKIKTDGTYQAYRINRNINPDSLAFINGRVMDSGDDGSIYVAEDCRNFTLLDTVGTSTNVMCYANEQLLIVNRDGTVAIWPDKESPLTAETIGAQPVLVGKEGQVVGFDSDGNAVPQDAPSSVFVVEYNVTPFADIKAAFLANTPCVFFVEGIMFTLKDMSLVSARFEGSTGNTTLIVTVSDQNVWTSEVVDASSGVSSWNDLTDKPFDSETGQIDANCIPDTIQRTITGTPGDFVVIGEDGKATTGEPPAGGGKLWQKIAEYDVGADIAAGVTAWEESGFSFDELRFVYKSMVSSTTSASGLMGYINDAYMQGVQLVRTNGSAQANGGSGWSEVRLVPDGVLTTQGYPAISPTNYALNGLSAALNAIPCDYSDGKIFRYRLSTNPSHPPVSGTFAVYGR